MCLSLPNASDQPRPPGGEAELLINGAMLSGSIIDDEGEIKGVALWMTGSASMDYRRPALARAFNSSSEFDGSCCKSSLSAGRKSSHKITPRGNVQSTSKAMRTPDRPLLLASRNPHTIFAIISTDAAII